MRTKVKLWLLISRVTQLPVVYESYDSDDIGSLPGEKDYYRLWLSDTPNKPMLYNPAYDYQTDRKGSFLNTTILSKGFRGNPEKGHECTDSITRVRKQGTYARLFDNQDDCVKVMKQLIEDDPSLKKILVVKRIKSLKELYKYNPSGNWRGWLKDDLLRASMKNHLKIPKGTLKNPYRHKVIKQYSYDNTGSKLAY